MRKEKKKSDCFSSAVKKSVIVFILCQNVFPLCSAASEIIGSSVVTSVSVVLNHEGRNQKEVFFDMTTAPPLPPPVPSDSEPVDAHSYSSSAYTAEETTSPAVVTTQSTTIDSSDSDSGGRAPAPVYVHSQPFVRDNVDEQQQQEQQNDVVEETTDSPVAVQTPSPVEAQQPSSPTPSPPSSYFVNDNDEDENDEQHRQEQQQLPSEPIVAVRVQEQPAEVTSEPMTSPLPTRSTQPPSSTLPPFFASLLSKASRRADDDGIRVIDALKDIVRQAQQQHAKNDILMPAPLTVTLMETGGSSLSSSKGNSNNNNNNNNLVSFGLPPVPMPIPEDLAPQKIMPGTGLNGDDDDEMEVEVNAGSLDPGAATTDVIDDFAKVVVMVQPEDNSEAENDTAPSAEVSDAMHKISGAILSSDDDIMRQRPVENIVNDVLGSINSRNNTKPKTPSPVVTTTTTSTTTTTTTQKPSPSTTQKPTTTTQRTTTTTTTVRPTTTSTRPPTTRISTTTTPRPTTQLRTTPKPTTTTSTTQRPTTTTRRTTTQPPRTTAKPTASTFLPRLSSSRVPPRTPSTTQRTTTTTRSTTTTRPPTQRSTTTLRPRPPQTTESFMYGNLFNSGLDVKTQQTLASIVKKDKPVMYSPDMDTDVSPPPYQGAPPPMSTKPPMPPSTSTASTTTSTTSTTTEKPMSALEVMIKQAEQMGRPFTPVVQVASSDIFDSEPSPIIANMPVQSQPLPIPVSLPQSLPPQQLPIDYRIPGIPVDESMEQSTSGQLDESSDSNASSGQVDAFDNELDQEEEMDTEVEFTSTLKPYVPPSKRPLNSMLDRRPENETTSSKRPNEFYDDEIFGFDPYQTFHHGVYVPLVEIQPIDQRADESSEEMYVPPPTAKPKRRKRPRPSSHNNQNSNIRPFVKQGKPTKPRPQSNGNHKISKKPVPSLPDYLHRPRPSHLQYQHGAADDTDPLTGLLNANYKHPGESYGPETQTFAPDRLLAIPPQALPQSIRKNLTDHHDHHYQHQHGLVVPGHGHGHGGGHGHGDAGTSHGAESHGAHGHVPNQPTNHLQSDSPVTVSEKRPEFGPAPPGNPGLEATLTSVDPEMRSFVDINNRIALRLFSSLTNPVSKSSTSYGNMVVSPFTITSSLSMLFLGARGNTASQLDGLLRLDDMLTFNPHMMYHNITQAFLSQPNTAAAMIRLLIADKNKGGILDFYRTRVQHFYDARVEQADYKFAGHLAQSIINQMIRAQIQRHSYELLNYSVPLSGPMSLLTATFFDGQFSGMRDPKVDGMNFIHLAALGRRLFPVPALSVKGKFRAAYDNDLDATAVEIPYTSRDLSLIVMMPGKPGEFSIGGVASLKSKLTLESWTQLMRGFYPREEFKVVLPRFRHQTAVNLTYTLKRFGLTDLFMSEQAKFKGVNGLVDLYVDENMMHFTEFATWEKLSDTMRETNMQNNKNLDLIRILRPYVRDQYGQYQEPLSVNDWISMSRNPPHLHQSQQRSRGPPQPPQSMDIRLALRLAHAEEKLKRRQVANGARSNTNPRLEPLRSFMRPKGKRSKTQRRRSPGPRRHTKRQHHRRQRRQANRMHARQDLNNGVEIEERVLKFERPFIYILRHNPTGMILMTGQYTEPVTEVLE